MARFSDQGTRRTRLRVKIQAAGTVAITGSFLALAATAWGAPFEICTVAASCKAADPSTGLGGEIDFPQQSATDAAGSVYVADFANHRVQKFDSSGNFQRAWGKDVINGNANTGFEVCVAGVDTCKTGDGSGTLGGEFQGPAGIATDTAGNVYVADDFNDRIQKFSGLGVFERTWGRNVDSVAPGTGFEICTDPDGGDCQSGTASTGLGGEMLFPISLATDASNNVYLADAGNNRIQKFSAQGVFERTWGRNVDSVAVSTGFEVCTDADGSDCKAADASTGLGGEMNSPSGVATDPGGSVYVADSDNGRIQQFTAVGAFGRTWGTNVNSAVPGTGFEICADLDGSDCKAADDGTGLGGEMSRPRGVATDAAGNIYVADEFFGRIERFNTGGTFNRAWGRNVDNVAVGTGFEVCTVAANCKNPDLSTGLGGEFFEPRAVSTGPGGSVYVTDTGNDRMQKFDSSGAFLRTWGNNVIIDPIAARSAPSNVFTVGGLVGKTLTLNVPSPGTVDVNDAGAQAAGSNASAAAKKLLKPSSATGGPGTIVVTLKLTKLAKQKLRERGKVRVNARITFTPNGGTAASLTQKLKIKK